MFLIYAVNFLCFFVDDEAVTFVYAQNVARGRGLSYSAFEGPTEGYSNFLHVWVATAMLAGVWALGLPKIAALVGAKLLSLASGVALVAVTGRAIRRASPHWAPQAAALGILALAGPLAVWSNSGLETVPFALLFTGFVFILLREAPRRWWPATALGVAVILARTDGFAYVSIAWVASFVVAPASRRRVLLTRVALPLVAVIASYHAWRYWYFGSLLSLPLHTKVLYRLLPKDGAVSYMLETSYLARFLAHYHPVPLVLLAAGWLPFWRRGDDRRPFALAIAGALLATYASIVGDWMFGFRFYVALFPILALLTGYSLGGVARRAPGVAVLLTVAVLAWSASTARAFVGSFERAEPLTGWRSWWRDPTRDPARFFGVFYPMYQDVRARLTPGTVTINNSAGFLPFLLDLENIDDVGLCSRFFANLPTADVIFTDVGRYHRLTDRPPLTAGERYLVYRDAEYLITLTDRLRHANDGHLRGGVLGGHYALVHQSRHEVMYQRVNRPRTDYQVRHFLENLAHPARVRMAARQGVPVRRAEMLEALPFLAVGQATYPLAESLVFELHLNGDPVYELWINSITATADARLSMTLYAEGRATFREDLPLPAGQSQRFHRELPHAGRAEVFTMQIAAGSRGATVTINDVRVLGQPPALRAHVEAELFRSGDGGRAGVKVRE
ncbi:MAG TPA: hypothetical protein VK886_12005 [Vicinamibacterales bacterium]|nr:hypothetical protein [Vicinamibacterales bacterium]